MKASELPAATRQGQVELKYGDVWGIVAGVGVTPQGLRVAVLQGETSVWIELSFAEEITARLISR